MIVIISLLLIHSCIHFENKTCKDVIKVYSAFGESYSSDAKIYIEDRNGVIIEYTTLIHNQNYFTITVSERSYWIYLLTSEYAENLNNPIKANCTEYKKLGFYTKNWNTYLAPILIKVKWIDIFWQK